MPVMENSRPRIMNIMIVNSLYAPNATGGAERSVKILAETLVNYGHQVTVVCLGKEPSNDVVNGVHVYYLKLSNAHWPFGEKHNLVKRAIWHTLDIHNEIMGRAVGEIILREKPDVIHTNNVTGFSVAVWSEATKLNVPIVHTIRDYYLLCVKSSMYSTNNNCKHQCLLCRIVTQRMRAATRHVKHVVGISRHMIQQHQSFNVFTETPYSVIYNSNMSVQGAGQEIKEGPLRLGYIGRLESAKGLDLLIDTYISSPVISGVDLLIAGDGDHAYIKKINSKIFGTRARIVGEVDSCEFLSKIDVLVVPSLWNEPFGRVIIEAYSHGVPVIASKRGGIMENVIEGRTGYIFDPDDPSTLRSLLEKFVEQPKLVRRMAQDCLDKSRDFLPEHAAEEYIEIYARMMKRGVE